MRPYNVRCGCIFLINLSFYFLYVFYSVDRNSNCFVQLIRVHPNSKYSVFYSISDASTPLIGNYFDLSISIQIKVTITNIFCGLSHHSFLHHSFTRIPAQGVTGGIRTLDISVTARCVATTPQPQVAKGGFEPPS